MRGLLHRFVLLAVAAAAAAAVGGGQADARMTVLYDLPTGVNGLTDPATPNALDPDLDGLYQQAIAPRGNEFPAADTANLRDGDRFVAKAVGRAPAGAGNCSNTYLMDADGAPLSPVAIADLLRDGRDRVESAGCVNNDPPAPVQLGVDTFASRMVFVEEVSGARWQSVTSVTLAAAFRDAIRQLAAEPAPADIPGATGYDPAPTMAQRVHVYLRFPQTLTVFPERWSDLRATLPLLGGVWLETYGYGGDERRAWDEARYATLLRPFALDHLKAGGDLRRLHLLMGPSRRTELQDPGRQPGDQWPWVRTGAACELLSNGPGAYRVGDGSPSDPWGEFGAGFRETFRTESGGPLAAGMPPDLAPSPIACAPAYRLTGATRPSAAQFAEAVALLGRGSIELPEGAIGPPGANGEIAVDVAAGLPGWLDRGFADRAGAVVSATGTTTTQAAVDPDGISRVPAPESDPAGIAFRITGIRGEALLDAARGVGGRVPDPHLSMLCPGARLPGEEVSDSCVDVITGRPGREWMPDDPVFGWLLASTTLVAPEATLTQADPAPPAQTRPAEPLPAEPITRPPATPPPASDPGSPTDSNPGPPPVADPGLRPACSVGPGTARLLCRARARRVADVRTCSRSAGTRRALCQARARSAYIRAAARIRRSAALAACRRRGGAAVIRCRARTNASYRLQLATATRITALAVCARLAGNQSVRCRVDANLAFRRETTTVMRRVG